MLRQNIMQLLWAITLTTVTMASSAHEKVVVIPLFGEDAEIPTSKTVFVTQMDYAGDLGGPVGADAKCQAEASAQGSMVQDKSFKAWVSGGLATDFTAPADGPRRVFVRSELPYVLVDGSVVANNFEDLVSGDDLQNSIEMHANGESVGQGRGFLGVWTGITSTGSFSSTNSCNEWSDASDGFRGVNGFTDLELGWSDRDDNPCSFQLHLYCFEQ